VSIRAFPGLAVLLMLMQPGVMQAQDIRARATVDSTDYLIGDWITVHVLLTHPSGATFQPLLGDTLGGFSVIRKEPFRDENGEAVGSVVFAKYDSGSAEIPPIPFLCSVPGDTTVRTVVTNPLAVTIHTVAVDTSKEIKDLKPPLSIGFTLAEILLYVGLVILAAALAVFLYRYWKKRPRDRQEERYVPPPRPAHVIAREQLGVLKEKKLWQHNQIKEYYSELTDIIRRYLENRYHVRALEQTTDEIMDAITLFNIPSPVSGELGSLLRMADLVKFAKFVPGVSDHEGSMARAYDFVDRTMVVPANSAGVETGQGVQADVGS
jgi:hypothetical protein